MNPIIDKDGTKSWINKKGQHHRIWDLTRLYPKGCNMNPIIDKDGTKTKNWFNKKGQLHRTDGPAIEWADGSKSWYLNGVRHRTDGPAYISANGNRFWYLNGVLHRTNGPAIEHSNGSKSWYLNGVRHRTDGPAVEVEHADGYKSWYLNGKQVLSEDLFMKLTGPVKRLPLYLGLGFDPFISERLQHETKPESCHRQCRK